MNSSVSYEDSGAFCKGARSHSAQGLPSTIPSPAMKIPLPPRLWLTDVEDESSDEMGGSSRDDCLMNIERPRVRSRFRHHKQRTVVNIPIGIFWDIENCQVPRGCSAIDVVMAIRNKFLSGRREADFVVVCDVRKEAAYRLQELNDAQVSLIHVCGTQKNAADEKLRQCMRRFGELHVAPAALLLISGDINFAADLSDFRHRKNMEVILVHKQNTSPALIACASSHYCYNELTAHLPRNPKTSQTEEEEEPTCEMEVANLPIDQPPERVSRRLRRLADNCGGKVVRVTAHTAMLRFPTPDHASRALKRMDGEDVFGRKISTRYARVFQPAYSSDEGYGTATTSAPPPPRSVYVPPPQVRDSPREPAAPAPVAPSASSVSSDWALALQALPAPTPPLPAPTPPLPDFCLPAAPKPRKIRGTHGSVNLDRSGCSSNNSVDENRREPSQSRAISPWNSSNFSEQSEGECESTAELTVANLPPYEPATLQEMLTQLFSQYVQVIRVSIWAAGEGPLATVVLRSEWDARLAIARVHKRRLENQWSGRRLELSLGRPSPAPNLEVLRTRLRAILLDQKNHTLPLLRLRDAYASRHCCALTTSDIAKVKDTVVIHEGFGRMVQLVDLTPVSSAEVEEAPWKCHIHAALNTGHEDGSRILQPVYMEIKALAKHTQMLLEKHCGILPLLSFVECYESMFAPLVPDTRRGVALELLLRSVPGIDVKDTPSRHLTWKADGMETPPTFSSHSESSRSSNERDRPRTAPALEPMLALFERELIDLLRTAPRCSIAFSKLIPAFHHHFGRQCRVADYGFTKLPDLLSALSNTIVVLGSGSSRVITISAAAQGRRWTSDLVKLLKAQPGRAVSPIDIPQLYQATFGRVFSPVDYGVCTLTELMMRVTPQSVTMAADGTLSLPRRTPTPEERSRTVQFAVQAVELLCYTPNLRMEFSRFVPAYHAHFGRQLRVAHYGCVKLVDLFELIPESVAVTVEPSGERSVRLTAKTARPVMAQRLKALGAMSLAAFPGHYAAQFGAPPQLVDLFELIPESVAVTVEPSGERSVRLTAKTARPVMAQRLKALGAMSLAAFPGHYAAQFGAPPQPDMLEAGSVEALVYLAGACVEEGALQPPGAAPRWLTAELAACAVLSADRSVARGSTDEYFASAFRRLCGFEPDLRHLAMAGVLAVEGRRILLTPAWRVLYRVAQILQEKAALTPMEVFSEYTQRYEPVFPSAELVEGRRILLTPAWRVLYRVAQILQEKAALTAVEVFSEYTQRYEPVFPSAELGVEDITDFLRQYIEAFVEVGSGRWALSSGVLVPRCRDFAPAVVDYSVHDTPPGQKGSRVFESPKTNIWCSPPASALPTPTALLNQEKRRIRLAAHFDSP